MTNEEARFFRAIEKDDIATVSALLDSNPHLIATKDRINGSGDTPLHRARRRNMAEFLISKGADANAVDDDGWTPLHVAFDAETALCLIAHGADVNAASDAGVTPLHNLVSHKEVAALLIAHGADIEAREDDGSTPLHRTAEEDYMSVDCYLINQGLEREDIDDDTPIERVQWEGQKAVAELLISHGVDVNARNKNGWTPLHKAAQSGFTDMAEILVRNGADVNVRSDDGSLPLHLAALHGHKYVAQFLITAGNDINAVDDEGKTPLDEAMIDGYQPLIRLLQDHHAETRYPYHQLSHYIRGHMRISLKDKSEMERFILLMNLGLMTALKEDIISIDEAECYLYSPYTARMLEKYGVSAGVIRTVMLGTELEDVVSLIPHRLQHAIGEIEAESKELLRAMPKPDLTEYKKWIDR